MVESLLKLLPHHLYIRGKGSTVYCAPTASADHLSVGEQAEVLMKQKSVSRWTLFLTLLDGAEEETMLDKIVVQMEFTEKARSLHTLVKAPALSPSVAVHDLDAMLEAVPNKIKNAL